jgi:hypothetical protein
VSLPPLVPVDGRGFDWPRKVAQAVNYLLRRDSGVTALSEGGTGVSLTDPGADRLLFWDDSAGSVAWLEAGAGLTITGTTISSSGGVSDGDKGDITVSTSGTVWTVDNDAITYAKMQNVSADSRLLGRGSASGSGDVEEISLGSGLSMSGTTLSASGVANSAISLNAMAALSGFTTVGTSGSDRTITESSGKAIVIADNNSSATLRVLGIYKAAPSTPYRVAVFIQPNVSGRRFYAPLVGWTDGTKYHVIHMPIVSNTEGAGQYEIQTWSNSTTRASVSAIANTKVTPTTGVGFWLGLRDNATNVFWELSADGVNFAPFYTIAKSSGYLGSSGYTNPFVGMFSYGQDVTGTNYPNSVTVREWDENGASRTF